MLLFLFAAKEAAEVSESGIPILPTLGEIFWAAICFPLLYVLVRYVFLPPILRVMDERSERIEGDLAAADKATHAASTLSSDLDEQLVDVRSEAAAILDQARSEAAAERLRIVSKAEREVAAMKEVAQGEIDRERVEALSSLKPAVASLSVNAASKVLGKKVAPESAKPVISQFFSERN